MNANKPNHCCLVNDYWRYLLAWYKSVSRP